MKTIAQIAREEDIRAFRRQWWRRQRASAGWLLILPALLLIWAAVCAAGL